MAENTSDQKIKEHQLLRKRRLGMSFLTYMVPFALVVLFWMEGMIPLNVVFHFAVYSVAINAAFFLLFQTNINLKFPDPSLTALQMAASLLPVLYVMYFLSNGQGRTIFLLIIAVPLMYGILALTIRQFIVVGAWSFFSYCVLVWILWREKPEVLDVTLEIIQLIAFVLLIVSSSIIGGFIYGMRVTLRERNHELTVAVEKINELANLDPLTGVFNRRRLFDVLSEESKRCRRGQGPFSVSLMDIDHFKRVNDVYGHHAGDDVLRVVAGAISGNIRNIDSFGRYGGEEFLLVLPQADLEGAAIKAERVRCQVEALRFSVVPEDFRITLSAGVAEYKEDESIDDMLARADKCLYIAKRSGRNRVVTENDKQ